MEIRKILNSGVNGVRSGAKTLWSKIVSGARKVRREAVKVKDAALGRDKLLQEDIDGCVLELNGLLDENFELDTFLPGVREAFCYIFPDEVAEINIDKSKKKGFYGFVNYVNGLFDNEDWRTWPNGCDDKILKVLRNVKKFKAPRSRVNALISPCEKLYKKYISETKKGEKLEGKIESYFDVVCEYLRKASRAEKRDSFVSFVCKAFENMKKVAKVESRLKLNIFDESTKESKTVGRWFQDYAMEVRSESEEEKVEAMLHICDKEYQGNGGFWKWLRKGGTKMQRASKLIKAVEKKAEKLGWIKDGKVIDEK